jgi:hemolysin activation/secretion protein
MILGGAVCSSHLANAAAVASAQPSPAANSHFDILEFRVLGNHLLPTESIERAVYPFLGTHRDIHTVEQAVAALEKVYRDAGFGTVYVDIPEQDVTNGVVRLKVTEGRLDEVHVHGERYFSGRQIRAGLPALVPGQTPNLPTLQSELTQLNARTADRSITPILKAGPMPGTIDVDLAVKDQLPVHGSIQYDNRHTADTTPNRATASVSYDDLWARGDSIGLMYQTAPAHTSDAEVLVANYLGHIGANGSLAVSYINTSSNVLALGTLGVLGKGSIYGAHWLQPIFGTATTSQSLNGGVDYKDVLTQVLPDASGQGGASVTAVVRYLNWSLVYSGAWRWPGNLLSMSAGLGFGVRSLINSTDQFENARYNGAPGYMYLRLSMNADQNLPARFVFAERMSGQWTAYPLVNNEQFSLGGVDTVRGYLEAEDLGDSGAAASAELHSPPIGKTFGRALQPILGPLYAFAFVDAGAATLVDPLPGQESETDLWSYGLGLQLDAGHGFSGAFDWAVPQVTGTRTRRGDGHIDFSVRYAH